MMDKHFQSAIGYNADEGSMGWPNPGIGQRRGPCCLFATQVKTYASEVGCQYAKCSKRNVLLA